MEDNKRTAFEAELLKREPAANIARQVKDNSKYTSAFTQFDWEMWQAASANSRSELEKLNQELQSLVVILPDDAEPQVGDTISFTLGYTDLGELDIGGEDGRNEVWWRSMYNEDDRIIRRNGKPVIYETQLKQRHANLKKEG